MTSLGRSRSRAVMITAMIVGITACLKSTEPQPSLLALSGVWNYSGVQTGPVRETLSGTLTISRESGTSFQGRLDLVGQNSQTGESRLLSGLVSGSLAGTNTVDFDADLEAPRRHVGQITADTITGTWVESSGGMSSGTFRIEREPK